MTLLQALGRRTPAVALVLVLSFLPGIRPASAFDLTDEEQAYVLELGTTLTEVGDNTIALGALLDDPQIADAAWTFAVVGYLLSFQEAHEEARQLDPPERLEDVHATYLQMLGLMDQAADDFIAGFDDGDPSRVREGSDKIAEAGALTGLLRRDLEAFEAEAAEIEADSVVDPAGRSASLTAATARTCADFDAYEWAQSVYDQDPDENEALDPDGDGIACPELPRGGAAPALWTDGIPERTAPATLLRVIDGDTIEIETREGEQETVRLIGIDTPETKDPRRPVQCFGAEATAFTSLLLSFADGTVYVERDVSDRDRFDRLLRYVWLDLGGEPYLLNEAIARSGYGDVSTFPPDVKYIDEIRNAVAFAREYDLGLWSACGGPEVPLADAAPPPAPDVQPPPVGDVAPDLGPVDPVPAAPLVPEPAPAAVAGSCDPSYPDVCIPPFPPDLDCGQIGFRRFAVVPPDPHGFDGDGDGIGCESG